MANDRVSQFPVEALVAPTSEKARVSQQPVEVLVQPDTQKARITSLVIEVLVGAPALITDTRVPFPQVNVGGGLRW